LINKRGDAVNMLVEKCTKKFIDHFVRFIVCEWQ